MVHDAESEPASNDASASMHDMMADLPPLLLGTYTPKDAWRYLRNSAASSVRAW